MEAHIDKKGDVIEVRPIRGNSRLFPYAVKAVLQWKYRPTYVGCEPVPAIIAISLIFHPGKPFAKP